MSENMRRLRQAIDAISFASEASTLTSIQATDAALAAVEQEMAALEAERDELRGNLAALEKHVEIVRRARDARPTFDAMLRALDPEKLPGNSEDCGRLWEAAIARIGALYAEKAAQ